MVVERRRGMQRDQAEEKEPDRRVRLPQLLGEWAVRADQGRQPAEEEQVRPVVLREPHELGYREIAR
jgi:hypothetical protein